MQVDKLKAEFTAELNKKIQMHKKVIKESKEVIEHSTHAIEFLTKLLNDPAEFEDYLQSCYLKNT